MPQPRAGTGPWGSAIRYWLNRKKWRQSDLVTSTGIRANTISRATRGFHVNTKTLAVIARSFGVPLEDVLVSPERALAYEERRRLIVDVVDEALRKMPPQVDAAINALEASIEQTERTTMLPTSAPAPARRRRSSRKRRP